MKAAYEYAVLPSRPGIDPISAMSLAECYLGTELKVLFWRKPDCTQAQIGKWNREGKLAIGLGSEDWRRSPCGSASESVASLLEQALSLTRTPGVDFIVRNMNRHNDKDGKESVRWFLNLRYMSIARLCRDLFLLPGFCSPAEVVKRTADVVATMILVKTMNPDSLRKCGGDFSSMFRNYLELMKKSSFAPFTIAGYLKDLWRSGERSEIILQKIDWWYHAWLKIQEAIQDADYAYTHREETGAISPDALKVKMLGNLKVIILLSDSQFLSRRVLRECDILIVRNPESGHTAILTRGQGQADLTRLAARLEKVEPGRWHFEPRPGQLINGGAFDLTPTTGVPPNQLFSLMEEVGVEKKSA